MEMSVIERMQDLQVLLDNFQGYDFNLQKVEKITLRMKRQKETSQ
jgi:hypothetical protein